MTNINDLITRIDHEIAAEVGRQKKVMAELLHANVERERRLQRYEAEAQHIIELVKPRPDAFIERFKPVIKVEPVVRQHSLTNPLPSAVRAAMVCCPTAIRTEARPGNKCRYEYRRRAGLAPPVPGSCIPRLQ